jgi:PAS domain S-box-containing protein
MNQKITKALPIYVLCLEDDLKDAELFQEMLHDSGYLVKMDIVSQEEQYISSLKANSYDIILADYTLPGFDAPAALKHATLLRPEVPFICVSGTIGEDTAVELLKQGATDYVLKDRIGRLAFAVKRALEEAKVKADYKKAAEALRESEERFRILFNKAPLGYHSLDFDGNFIEVNQQWLHTLGYAREEVIGKWFGDFLTPAFQNGFLQGFPIFKAQGFIHSEFEMVHKNGNTIFIAFDGKIGYDLKGDFKQTHCILQDITERKQAEKALEESELTFRKLFEESSDAILLIDETGVFIECNQAALDLLKMTREQFLFLAPEDISPEFQPNGHTSKESAVEMIDLANQKGLNRFDWTYVNAEGGEFIVDISLMPIVVKGKKMLHTTWRNITERKKAEEALRESEERFRVAQEMSPDGFTILHPVSNEKAEIVDFTWVYENQTIARINGTDPQEVIGKRLLDIFPDHRGTSVFETYLHVANTGRTQILEEIYVGEIISRPTWLRLVIVSMGKYIAILSQDITERKKTEEALHLSENNSAFLAQTAFELVELTSIQEIYKYTVQKLYDLFEGNSIVSLVEFNYSINQWKMQQIKGVGKKAAKLTRLLGFDVNSMEGDISTKYYEQITSSKVTELDFDFPDLFNNKLSAAIGSAVKKMFSIEKMYCIAYQQDEQIIGSITFTTNKKSQPINTKLIETFIQQVSNFAKKQKAEELLKESEERFKALHNASFGGIAILSEGMILGCNQGLSETTGYSLDELIGMDGLLLIAPESRDMAMDNILAGYEKPYEAVGLRKNGELYPLRLEARNIPYKGKTARTFEFRDITESKNAEEELIKLSSAVEQSPVSILITDIKGNMEYVNTKALTLTGYEFEELKGKNPRIFSSGDTPRNEYRILWETLLAGKEWRGELHNKKKNGELYWEFASISAIKNKMGQITHFLAVKEDITERKQAERDLQELEIARKTARFKQNFLANMSHEIRTPLTGVLGMIDILELTQLNEDQQDYVNTIKTSGENLKEIINQVLDYSKIEAGKIKINPFDFEFQSILQNAEMLYRNITRPGVKVLTQLDPAIPRFIKPIKPVCRRF